MSFNSIAEIILSVAQILQPVENLTVSEAAERFREVNNPGAYVGKWKNKTTPMMVEPMDLFASRKFNGVIFVGPAQSGKPIAVTTPVSTPEGWKLLRDIRPGDMVFDAYGHPTKVTYVTETFLDRDCYEITFDDGTNIVADGVHRWSVNDMWADDPYAPVVLDTNRLRDSYKVLTSKGTLRYRYSIPVAGALQLPEAVLPIDPYVLGLWLGDGSQSVGALTIGLQDAREIETNIALDTDCEVVSDLDGNAAGTARRFLIRRNDGVPLATLLREANLLGNKHIPDTYLRASESQRRELLRGLMDSDGTVAQTGRIEFSQSRVVLFNQCVELVRSLGLKPMLDEAVPHFTYKGERKAGQVCYTLAFSLDDARDCFKLFRQIKQHRKAYSLKSRRPTHSGRRFIRKIEAVTSVPVKCISVDNASHLFLVGEQMVPTHNTDSLVLNTIAYSVRLAAMDMMLVCPTMAAGRDFSMRRIDRLHRHSPEIGNMLLSGSDHDNKFDKHYRNGMLLTISWPTPTELAGKPIGRILLTDYDRMPMDVDGDGNPYDLAAQRTTTFGSYAMTLAESSPSKEITDIKWIARSPHEAPPCEGILSLYNRGDRRRWYWPCPHCNEYFEGKFEHLTYKKVQDQSNFDIAETVMMQCPFCHDLIHPDQRDDMQQKGRWLKDGQAIEKDGTIFGPSARSLIASFWLRGVAATFTSWRKLINKFLDATDDFERTGSEDALRKFYNNDLAEPYLPKSSKDVRLPEVLKSRADRVAAGDERKVPVGVRFLVATVDVQKNMFVVQVFGISPGKPFDIVCIDRFEVKKSKRTDDNDEHLWVKPATYLEDWDELIENVIEKEYELVDGSGRMMAIKATGCDSGGREGVTMKAYDFWRSLVTRNLHRRFILIKGDPSQGQPRTRISYPDSNQRDNKSAARGDVPVLMLNSNMLKDDLNGRLDSLEPGKGMFRTQNWFHDKFFAELCVEVRTMKGWENPAQHRNEAWDLSYYAIGLCLSPLVGVDKYDWSNPPGWATDWSVGVKNDFVREQEAAPVFVNTIKSKFSYAELGKQLA